MRPGRSSSFFNRFAKRTARAAGKPMAFFLAVIIVVFWAVTGPIFGFSDTWQLVINTGTTVVTFLMYSSCRTPSIVTPKPSRSNWMS